MTAPHHITARPTDTGWVSEPIHARPGRGRTYRAHVTLNPLNGSVAEANLQTLSDGRWVVAAAVCKPPSSLEAAVEALRTHAETHPHPTLGSMPEGAEIVRTFHPVFGETTHWTSSRRYGFTIGSQIGRGLEWDDTPATVDEMNRQISARCSAAIQTIAYYDGITPDDDFVTGYAEGFAVAQVALLGHDRPKQ